MVQIVSGTGIDRILSAQEVREDQVASRLQAQVVAGNAARADALSDVRAVRAHLRADEITDLVKPPLTEREGEGDAREVDQLDRRPQLGSLLDDPQQVNEILQETQGVDTPFQQGLKEQQAALLEDAYRRALFIATIDPGRSPTVLAPRDLGARLNSNRFG